MGCSAHFSKVRTQNCPSVPNRAYGVPKCDIVTWSLWSLLAMPTTTRPASTSLIAVALPMPALEPVTTATRPFRWSITLAYSSIEASSVDDFRSELWGRFTLVDCTEEYSTTAKVLFWPLQVGDHVKWIYRERVRFSWTRCFRAGKWLAHRCFCRLHKAFTNDGKRKKLRNSNGCIIYL